MKFVGYYLCWFLSDPVDFLKTMCGFVAGNLLIIWGVLGLLFIIVPVRPYYSTLADNIATKCVTVAIWGLVTGVGIVIWKMYQRDWDRRMALKFIGGFISGILMISLLLA